MAPEEVPTGDIVGIVDDDIDDEALRQIENELAVVEEAMSERQRSLAEVDQRLNDLQAAPSCNVVTIRPSLDTVTEATTEEMGTTPLLRNSRSVSSGVGEVICNAPVANGDFVTGTIEASFEQLASTQKTVLAEEAKSLESPLRQPLKQPRSIENLCTLQKDVSDLGGQRACGATAPATNTPGASTSVVSRMYSMPTRSDSIPRPPRPLVMSGSLNGAPRGPTRHGFFNQPSVPVANTSPWRNSSLSQQLANGSSDSLSRGVSPSPATPRGSSMPADSRRIFAPQTIASPQPSVGSPRSSAGMTVPGSMTPLTPRLPLQTTRSAVSGYPSASSGALGGQQSLEGTPRPRSVSAGQVSVPSTVSQVGGNMSARQLSTVPFTQYGSRFSAVAPASTSSASMSAIRAPSRGSTPQPLSSLGNCRFVPVSQPPANGEVQRGREGSQNPGSHRATSTSTSLTRGGSPPPGIGTAPFSSPGVVRQSSAVRPIGATRQVSVGSTSAGSTTPAPGTSLTTAGSFGTCPGSLNVGEDAPAPTVPSRALSPPHVAAVAAACAAAVTAVSGGRNGPPGTLRHTLGGNPPGTSTPQPSRYAYVNSTARRDCQPQANQRDVRRRGRM